MSLRDDHAGVTRVARRLAEELGLDAEGARVQPPPPGVGVLLPRAEALVRVEALGDIELAERRLRVARLLEQRRVPALRAHPALDAPRALEGRVLSLWRAEALLPEALGPRELGALCARLHRRTLDPPPSLPLARPFAEVEASLDGRALLQARCRVLEAEHEALVSCPDVDLVVVQGALLPDAVGRGPSGPLLLDLDRAGRGVAAWDLAFPLVRARRFGGGEAFEAELWAGYGPRPTEEALAPYIALCELLLAGRAWARRRKSAKAEAEARLRVASLETQAEGLWTAS